MSEHWIEVYKLQYERIGQHENQRLNFSNLVLVSSCAALALGAGLKGEQNFFSACYLALLVVAINVVAIIHAGKARFWVKFHQAKARELLRSYDTKLLSVLGRTPKPDSNKDYMRRPELQKILHGVFVILAIMFPLIVHLGSA